ncbi:MAG: DUF1456 family protein [Flavobacteriaceae bacterium]|nr:DUF1456 family protein [Flavobacteriaceae bacterium]
MTNNDILRRLRYTFDFNDDTMISIFALADQEVTRAQISDWLKKEDAEGYVRLDDRELAVFLNGFINKQRGKREGEQPAPEEKLNNNIIFRKLKIALNLKDFDIIDILQLADFRLGKAELNAFFRKPNHNHYRRCKDQILRNFLHGLQIKYRK